MDTWHSEFHVKLTNLYFHVTVFYAYKLHPQRILNVATAHFRLNYPMEGSLEALLFLIG